LIAKGVGMEDGKLRPTKKADSGEREIPSPRPMSFGSKKNNSPTNEHQPVPVRAWQYVGLAFFCFVAAFFGSWVFLATGIVDKSALDSITENRTNIVVQEGELVADIVEKVGPSVVSIVTSSGGGSFRGTSESSGTGIVISSDGYILTNRHVIPSDTTSVEVVMSDGTVHRDVRVVGRDPLNDLGFLKINRVNDLQAAEIGDSYDVNVGQQVIAIGNALGQFQNTVTSGIISGIGRPVQAAGDDGGVEQLENLFQTDAAINPGNSGGPLLNLEGQVIGVNTAIAERAEGIGFAIPINAAKGLMRTVTESGEVRRAFLGVQYRSITPALARELDLPVSEGAYLSASGGNAVSSGTPAARAGLEDGDIITRVNDRAVNERTGLALLLAEHTPGEEVTLTVLRGEREIEIKVTLGTYDR
jgi:serine protease Do